MAIKYQGTLEAALKAWEEQYRANDKQYVDKRGRVRDCPPPIRYGQDQYRCAVCNRVWDVDEPRPTCQNNQVQQPQRDRP